MSGIKRLDRPHPLRRSAVSASVRTLASMPRSVHLSLWLFLGGVALGFAMIPFDPRPWPPRPEVQLVLTIAALPGAIRDAVAHLGGAPVTTTIYAAVFCAEIVAVASLFTRTSSLWYRHASAGSPAS